MMAELDEAISKQQRVVDDLHREQEKAQDALAEAQETLREVRYDLIEQDDILQDLLIRRAEREAND